MWIAFLPFLLLIAAFASLWISSKKKVWAGLFILFLLAAFVCRDLRWSGVCVVIAWAGLWLWYEKKKPFFLFMLLVILGFGYKYHLLPGFHNVHITEKFYLAVDSPLIGFFPLALVIPLARRSKDWTQAICKGFWLTALGITFMTILALASGAVSFEAKIPSHGAMRYMSNFFFVAIPEEGFFRGFIQSKLLSFFPNNKKGEMAALLLSSLIFTVAHFGWTDSPAILGFVFLAGLLYGTVYLISKRIESAILCHFLLNFIHMTFFSYHAM